MSEIQKYSREWFVTNQNQKQVDAVKNLKDAYFRGDLDNGDFETELFIGTREEVQKKVDDLENDPDIRGVIQPWLISRAGGLDSLLNMLDEDGNGEITQEEVSTIAALDKIGFDEVAEKTLSMTDLKVMYEIADEADGAAFEKDGSVNRYTFKDGEVEELELDDKGEIISRSNEFNTINNEKLKTAYNYQTNTYHKTIKDSEGRLRYEKVDAPGRVNDKTVETTFDEKGRTAQVKTDTVGRKIIVTYDYENNKKTTQTTLKYNSDSVIGNTKQQDVGDCWILSGVNALRDVPNGAKAIKDAIKQNADGSVTVTLKGVNKAYKYNPEQIGAHEYTDKNKEYSDGDIDMILIEMAIKDYRRSIMPSDPAQRTGKLVEASPEDPINGGFLEEAIQYITGKESKNAQKAKDIEKVLNDKQKKQDRYAVMVQFKADDTSITEGEIKKDHAYQVKKVTKDTVYIVNPWDSSQEIAYPRDSFKNNALRMTSADLQ